MLFCHDDLVAVKRADTDPSASGADIEPDNVDRLQLIPYQVGSDGRKPASGFPRALSRYFIRPASFSMSIHFWTLLLSLVTSSPGIWM